MQHLLAVTSYVCLQQQCCNLLLWAPKINVCCLCAVWNRPMDDFTDIWQHSQLLSVQTYSSWANSGITRNVRQPWRFLDLRISPKMWSPMYKISFPFAPSRSHIMSEEPVRRWHFSEMTDFHIYIRHTQYTEKSCIMNSVYYNICSSNVMLCFCSFSLDVQAT